MNEIEQFYSSASKKQANACKGGSTVKDKDKHIPSMKKQQQEAALREAAAAKRMQELMRQFGTILRQVMNLLAILLCSVCICVHDSGSFFSQKL